MFASSAVRAIATIAVLAALAAPALAQSALGPYVPTTAKYRLASVTKTSQLMMGAAQEFEADASQLVSLSVARSGEALALAMTLDSLTVTTTAPGPAPELSDATGMKYAGTMAPDGKVASSAVTDKAGAPSTSQFAGSFRSFLPRLSLGAKLGATWTDSTSYDTNQGDNQITTSTVVNYTLAGDTLVADTKAWKIVGNSTSKITGKGSRNGADYTIAGGLHGTVTAVVSAGVLLGEQIDSVSSLTVTVEAAGMTIPITQTTSAKISKLP